MLRGGELVVSLYDNKDGIPKLLDLFTAEIQSGIIEDTPETPEALGLLSFDSAAPENLVISGVICRSLDEPLPMSAAVRYDANGFDIVPVSFCTMAATDVTKTSAVLHGQVITEDGTELNAADFGFLFFDSLESDIEERDEDGDPVGVVLPEVLPAASISSDGHFSLPLTNLESGREYQYMAAKIGSTAYGEPMGFTTKSDLPTVETGASAEINSEINVVTIRGTIIDTKGFEITESGVMFGTNPDSAPTGKSPNQSGLAGIITSYLGSLDPGKTYYYRAYAKSSAGTGYGKTYNFTMPAVLPAIKSRPSVIFDQIAWKAAFSAKIISDGGAEITGFGFRIKDTQEWKYYPSQTIDDSNTFTLELEGQEQIPIGYNQVEAYVTNTVGMVTMAVSNVGFLTPSRARVNADLDNTLVTVSSAVLKGDISIIPDSDCLQRGFEYKAVSDNLWIEAGMETGTFGSGEYTFTIEGLRPYTEYVFRAKAQTLAGWSYSPEIGFTTIFSDIGKETAYQMKMDGKTGQEILAILKNNLHQDISEACVSLKFAGLDASSIAAALKPAPYKAPYNEVAKGLLSAGFNASTAAKALKAEYLDVFEYIGGDIADRIIKALYEQGYPKDDVIKALREVFGKEMLYIGSYLGISNDDVFDSLIRTYGVYAFSADFWREHNTEQYTDGYISQLTTILKNCTDLNAGDIVAVLKDVYPQLTASKFIANCRQIFPAVSDMGDALIQAFNADSTTAAREMYIYSDLYTIEGIKSWLINKQGLNASQVIKILIGLPNTNPMNTVPVLLKNDLGITAALDAARVMYAAGWREETGYSYWRPFKLLIDHYDCTSSDLIEIMKELGLSPLAVAQQMEALRNNNFITSWRPEYRALGYTASELAGWCRTTSYYDDVDQAVIIMGNTGYSLDEITAALKQVYELDAGDALTILKYDTFTYTYKWWTEEQAIAAVDLVYNTSTLDTVINEMKAKGAAAAQIASTLKEAFAVTEPGNVADYLMELGYDKNEVLQALAQSFRSLKNPELVQVLSKVLKDKFSEEPMENMGLILSLYESVKGNLYRTVNGVILLHNSGLGLRDITLVLKNDIDTLHNVTAKLTAFEAGQLLLGMKSYGLSYNRLDILNVIQEVYGANFMLETVIDYRESKKYTANTAITKLKEDFSIDTPSAAAMCLREAGYNMAEVLEGFIEGYSSEKSIHRINLLRQVLADVYPEVQAPLKTIMEAMEITDPGHVAETLYRAGFSIKEIIMVLQNEYGLSSGEVTGYLYDRNFEDIVLNVEDVYGGNGYLDFILYRKSQGDSITQLFDWLCKKFRLADISQIINILKLSGYSSEDVITLLYEKQKVETSDAILQVQDVFGEDSIQSYINHRKSNGDNIAQAFNWLQKFGVKDVRDIVGYLSQAGYSSSELIEFLFGRYIEVDNAILDVESTFGKNTIVDVLKLKKTQGWKIENIYLYLKDTLNITNLTQIANYLRAVGYTGYEIMNLLYQRITDTSRYGEIIAAVQTTNGDKGTDAVLEFLHVKKQNGESINQLYNWLKDKFNITDMTQTVTYLRAAGYTNSEIMDLLYQAVTEPGRYAEIASAIQAANAADGTDAILEFLCAKKDAGYNLTLMYSWLKDKFNITDITQTVNYLKAVGYTNNEIIDSLYQVIKDQSSYREIVAAVQAANATDGTDVVLEFLHVKKQNGESINQLYNWLKDKFNITDMTQTVTYLRAAGYTNSEIMDLLYQTVTEPGRYAEIASAIQAANAADGTDAILEFLCAKKDAGYSLTLMYSWLKDKFNITDITQTVNYLKAVGYTNNEIIDSLYQVIKDQSSYREIVAAVQAANATDGTDVVLEFLRAKKEAGHGLTALYEWLKDKFNITDIRQTAAYLKAVGYTSSEIITLWHELYGGEPGDYEEEIESTLAASNTDITLDFLREKKNEGENLIQLYGYLNDFGINDINRVSSYFLALGYNSSDIIEFLYQRINDPSRYKEIVAAVQAASASTGSDTILEFLRYKKSMGEGLTQFYDWLKNKFDISDINKVSSYFLALGYNSNEIIGFLYQEIKDTGRYEEIVAAVQAVSAATGSDTILEFLRYKKSMGEGLTQFYGWLKDNFGISDINRITSYFVALGYNSSDIIEFLYQRINDPSRYEEIAAAVQAASASKGSDTVLDFLRYKKSKGEGLDPLYGWLKDRFGISDINRITSYFVALGYNSSEIIEFLFQEIKDTGRYEEIAAAVQAASASKGSDTVLEFLRYKKSKGEGLDPLYGWLKNKFVISDLNRIASYFLALGYNSSEIIEFLIQKIKDTGRYEEIAAAVQAASASTGSDIVLEFLRNRKSKGEDLDPLYYWLSDKFGISDLTKISSYFLALGYNSSEIIEFLIRQINDPGRYEEIVKAVQAAMSSNGSDAILEFLKYKKSKGEGLDPLYDWLKVKFKITDVSKILWYFKEIGYSSLEIIEFAYSGQTNLNELMIASMQRNYSDDSVIELLVFRKSRGGSLTELYELLAQLNITEVRQVAAFLQAAGFSGAEVAAFFKQKEINSSNQIITLIQSVYGENTITDFLVDLKNKGYSAGACQYWLMDKLGIDDMAKIARYLNDAGFNDGEIINVFDSTGDVKGFTVLKALYPAETPAEILARLMATPSRPIYSTHRLVCGLKQVFPELKYSEIVLMIRDAGEELNRIIDWLLMVNYEGAYYLGLPKSDLDDLASILGSRNQNDLKLGTRKTSYILSGFGYSLEEVVYWAKYGKFSSYEVFKILQDYWVGMVGSDKMAEQLLAMESNGYTLAELAEAVIEYYREGKLPPGSGNAYLVENPYSTASNSMMLLAGMGKSMPDVVTAMIQAGIAPRYMINALHGYWYDRFYWKDPMPNHYPHTSDEFALLNIVTWVYDAVESLPEERLADIDIVEETAAGLYTIRDTVGAESSKVFEAMMFITGKMSVNWSEKIPQTDVYAIDDLLNTVNSFVSAMGKKVNNILERVLVVNAMRTAGYNNDEATDLLKSVVGTSYLMNFAMQVMGGYNIIDSWNAVMRVDAYRAQVLIDICWTIACNAYKLDDAYKVLKDIKKVYDKLKKICMFLIDKGVLQAAPEDMTMAAFAGFDEAMPSRMAAAEISDVTFSAGESSAVTVRGTVTSGAGADLLLLVKKAGCQRQFTEGCTA